MMWRRTGFDANRTVALRLGQQPSPDCDGHTSASQLLPMLVCRESHTTCEYQALLQPPKLEGSSTHRSSCQNVMSQLLGIYVTTTARKTSNNCPIGSQPFYRIAVSTPDSDRTQYLLVTPVRSRVGRLLLFPISASKILPFFASSISTIVVHRAAPYGYAFFEAQPSRLLCCSRPPDLAVTGVSRVVGRYYCQSY